MARGSDARECRERTARAKKKRPSSSSSFPPPPGSGPPPPPSSSSLSMLPERRGSVFVLLLFPTSPPFCVFLLLLLRRRRPQPSAVRPPSTMPLPTRGKKTGGEGREKLSPSFPPHPPPLFQSVLWRRRRRLEEGYIQAPFPPSLPFPSLPSLHTWAACVGAQPLRHRNELSAVVVQHWFLLSSSSSSVVQAKIGAEQTWSLPSSILVPTKLPRVLLSSPPLAPPPSLFPLRRSIKTFE